MPHEFVVTECTRMLIRQLLMGVTDRILELYSLERRISVTVSFQFPMEGNDHRYIRHNETVRVDPVPEKEVLISFLKKAHNQVNPFRNPELHCSTVGHMSVAAVSEPSTVNVRPRIMTVSVWTPGTASCLIARNIALYAPELWDDVLRLLLRDIGLR